MRRVLSVCIFTGLLTGCATPAFVPPSGNGTVKLEVQSNLPVGVTMSLFTYENGLNCSGRQLLNGGTSIESALASQTRLRNFDTRLRSETVQTLDGFFSQGNSYCRITVSFYPQSNRIYTARPGLEGGKCFLLVFDTTASVNGVLEKSLTRREPGEPLLNGAWCKSMAESVISDKMRSASSPSDVVKDATSQPGSGEPDRSRGTTLDDLQDLLPSNK